MRKHSILYGLLIGVGILFSSCVSNKKHQMIVDNLTAKYSTDSTTWENRLNTAQMDINQLQLQLAERKGENNILVDLRQELLTTVDSLEIQIDNMNTNSLFSQQTLNNRLQEKDETIKKIEDRIASVHQVLSQHFGGFETMMQEFRDSLRDFDGVSYQARADQDEATLVLTEDLLFRNNSVTRITNKGYDALDQISRVFQHYPSVKVIVIAHTDNSRPKSRSYKDNWEFSALQAATVVRTLIEEYDMTSNQVLLGAKGEYEPRASNATAEGRESNRRIEFRIQSHTNVLVKQIRQQLDKE